MAEKRAVIMLIRLEAAQLGLRLEALSPVDPEATPSVREPELAFRLSGPLNHCAVTL